MMWCVWLGVALATDLVIDARVPTEIYVAGHYIGEVAFPVELKVKVEPGPTTLGFMIDHEPHKHTVDVPDEGTVRVLVGRTGVTTGLPEMTPDARPVDEEAASAAGAAEGAPTVAGPVDVQFRSSGQEGVVLVLGHTRHRLSRGEVKTLSLKPGEYKMSVRNESGTVMWSAGTLQVEGKGLVVQVSEGHMPELSGEGGVFRPDGA